MKRLVLLVAIAACGSQGEEQQAPRTGTGTGAATGTTAAAGTGAAGAIPPAPPLPPVPLGLPAPPSPPSAELVALGELLFAEAKLGKDGRGSCASCHAPPTWTSGKTRDDTLGGKPNLRHTPTIANLVWAPALGWDGRWATLADAVEAHWKGQLAVTPDVAPIAADPTYQAHFARVGRGPTTALAVEALAAFVATRYVGDAPFDRVERGDADAAPALARTGYELFNGKGQCSTCHVPPLYTDGAFHKVITSASPDEGRGRVDAAPGMIGAFRTPTLRGAARTAPYFHDGSAATLADAIAAHAESAALGPSERAAVLAFVEALSR